MKRLLLVALLAGCAGQTTPANPEAMAVLDELDAYVERMRAEGVLWRDDHYQSAKENIARDRAHAMRNPPGECHPDVPCPSFRAKPIQHPEFEPARTGAK